MIRCLDMVKTNRQPKRYVLPLFIASLALLASTSVAAAGTAKSYRVQAGQPYAILSLSWPQGHQATPIRLIAPSGEIIEENQFVQENRPADSGLKHWVTFVPDLTGPTKKTVVVANPRP